MCEETKAEIIARYVLHAFLSAGACVSVLALALYYVSPIVENVLTFGMVDVLDYLLAGGALFVMMYALYTVRKIMDWNWGE